MRKEERKFMIISKSHGPGHIVVALYWAQEPTGAEQEMADTASAQEARNFFKSGTI